MHASGRGRGNVCSRAGFCLLVVVPGGEVGIFASIAAWRRDEAASRRNSSFSDATIRSCSYFSFCSLATVRACLYSAADFSQVSSIAFARRSAASVHACWSACARRSFDSPAALRLSKNLALRSSAFCFASSRFCATASRRFDSLMSARAARRPIFSALAAARRSCEGGSEGV